MSRGLLGAFLSRDWRTDLSYRAAFGLQIAGSFLTLTLFYYLGRVVEPTEFADRGLSGGYFGFVAIGLALMQIVQTSLSSFSRKLRDEQTTGTFEALMATPASPSAVILASAAYDLFRATVTGLLLVGAAIAVFDLGLDADVVSALGALAALLGCIGLFAAIGVGVAAFTVVFKRATGLLALVAAVLGLLGGVYFPIEVLPSPVEQIAEALPFTWALDSARDGLLGAHVPADKLAGLWASVAVLVPLSLAVFSASLKRARKTGTLGQY